MKYPIDIFENQYVYSDYLRLTGVRTFQTLTALSMLLLIKFSVALLLEGGCSIQEPRLTST